MVNLYLEDKSGCVNALYHISRRPAIYAVFIHLTVRPKTNFAHCGIEYAYGHLQHIYTPEDSWNPTSKILGHERWQRDPHAASVIAQQHSSQCLFIPTKNNLTGFSEKVLISIFFTFFELRKSDSASLETAIVWGVRIGGEVKGETGEWSG